MLQIIAPLVALALSACVATPGKIVPPSETATPSTANAAGAAGLMPILEAEAGPTENILFSPASIEQAFGVLHLGAAGATKDQIEMVLPAVRTQQPLEHDGNDVEVRIANALWLSDQYRFHPSFLDAARTRYDATAERLDFSQPVALVERVNAWADRETEGLISQVLSPDSVTPETVAFITNALYFDGLWAEAFDGWDMRPFLFGDGSEREFRLMRDTFEIALVERDGWRAVRLPYADDRYAMDVVIPRRRTVMDAAPSLDWLQATGRELGTVERRNVTVSLPQFEVDTKAALIPHLRKLGLSLPFDRDRADLTAMAEPGQQKLTVDDVQHLAKLQVFDTGTRAAAVTTMRIITVGLRIHQTPPVEFTVDRPFVILIRDLDNGTILFAGKIAAPEPFTPEVREP